MKYEMSKPDNTALMPSKEAMDRLSGVEQTRPSSLDYFCIKGGLTLSSIKGIVFPPYVAPYLEILVFRRFLSRGWASLRPRSLLP